MGKLLAYYWSEYFNGIIDLSLPRHIGDRVKTLQLCEHCDSIR